MYMYFNMYCVYCCSCPVCISYVYLLYYVCIAVFTFDAGLLARSQYSEGPVTGHLDTGFSWFPCVYKEMLRWFTRFQVAATCLTRVTAFGLDTHPSCLHLTSNQQQLENQKAYVVTKRYCRELLMMGVMVPETC